MLVPVNSFEMSKRLEVQMRAELGCVIDSNVSLRKPGQDQTSSGLTPVGFATSARAECAFIV